MILKGESAEEFNRKADENYEKFKEKQKKILLDMMEAAEELGLYEKHQPTEDVEALALKEYPNGMPFSDENLEQREAFIKGYQLAKKFLETEQATKQVVKDSLTTKKQRR